MFTECVAAEGTLESSHGPFPHLSSLHPVAPKTPPPSSLSSVIPPSSCDTLRRLLQLPVPLPLPSLRHPALLSPSSRFSFFLTHNLSALAQLILSVIIVCKLICGQPASLHVIMMIMAWNPVICHGVVLAACVSYTC